MKTPDVNIIIADKLIASEINLNHISGFSRFTMKPDSPVAEALLEIKTDQSLQDWEHKPIHSFPLEDEIGFCDFARKDTILYFRIVSPEGDIFLSEIHPEGKGYLCLTNLSGQSPLSYLRFSVWTAFGIAALSRNIIAIHASTITYAGKSVLFLGESGTGKSTHTRLWLKHIPDTELLNDDSPFLMIDSGRKLRVYGSPWSGKTPCYKDIHTPVAAMVRLSQAPENKIRLLSKTEAMGALLPSFPPSFMYDPELSEKVYAILSAVLQETPVYHLECLPDEDAARLVFQTLKESGRL